jgi:hypothetical protein
MRSIYNALAGNARAYGSVSLLSRSVRVAMAVSLLLGSLPGSGSCNGIKDARGGFGRTGSDFQIYADSVGDYAVAVSLGSSERTAIVGSEDTDNGPDFTIDNTRDGRRGLDGSPKPYTREGKTTTGSALNRKCYWQVSLLSPVAGGIIGLCGGWVYLGLRYARFDPHGPRPKPGELKDTIVITTLIGAAFGLVVGQAIGWTACK